MGENMTASNGANLSLWWSYAEFCETNGLKMEKQNLRNEIRNLTLMRQAVEAELAQVYGAIDGNKTQDNGMRYFSYNQDLGDWVFKGNKPASSVTVNFSFKGEHEPSKENVPGKSFEPETWAAIQRTTN